MIPSDDNDDGRIRHLFDLALADGIDRGLYAMTVKPGDTEASIGKGPGFLGSPRTTDKRLIHIQVWLDALLESQDRT